PSQTAAVTQPAQQQAAKPAAAPAKTPVASESTVTATNSTKPPKPKVRRAEASPLAITSEPSIAPREDRAKEDADTVKEDEWIRLRGMPQAIANNMDASLSMPTATTVRDVPVKALIDNRTIINNHLQRTRG